MVLSNFKRVFCVVLCFVLIALIAGCAISDDAANNNSTNDTMINEDLEYFGSYVIIETVTAPHNYGYEITMYDPETYVMYRYTRGTGYEAFTELWNADGTLQIYYEAMNAVG